MTGCIHRRPLGVTRHFCRRPQPTQCRFQGMLEKQFGSKKLLQEFLQAEKFQHRMLPRQSPTS